MFNRFMTCKLGLPLSFFFIMCNNNLASSTIGKGLNTNSCDAEDDPTNVAKS